MDQVLIDKILQLEAALLELKKEIPAPTSTQKSLSLIKKVLAGILTYWVLITLFVIWAVSAWHGVSLYENIKNSGINKKSSDYYYHIGDKLLSHAEFKAAGEAFAKSLEINSYNIDSTHGLMKAQVFQAVGDGQTFNPSVVEDKLTYLRDIFGKDDYILLYWEGMLRRKQSASAGDLTLPESLFQQSIDKNPSFLGSHLELGNTYLLSGRVDKAIEKFKHVLSIDPRFGSALNDLGYCQLVLTNFEEDPGRRAESLKKASGYLEQASKFAGRPETDLHLGDAYLFRGQYNPARISHENALASIEKIDTNKKDYTPFELLLVFLPETAQEDRDREAAISISTPSELKMLVLYSLSVDHAHLGDLKKAEDYFNSAQSLDPKRLLSPLVANRMYSNYCVAKAQTKNWLKNKIETLCHGLEDCKPKIFNGKEGRRVK